MRTKFLAPEPRDIFEIGSCYTCTAASMCMLLAHYGVEASEGEMAALAEVVPFRGAPMFAVWLGLRDKLEGTGLKPVAARLDYDELKALGIPCVVNLKWSWMINHAVFVKKADEGSLVIGNPLDKEFVVWTREKFSERWFGNCVYLEREK